MARTGIAAPGAGQDGGTGRDDDAALAALLGGPDPVRSGPAAMPGRGQPPAGQQGLADGPGKAEGPGLSDLAAGLTRDELEDVLSALFDTGEERDPDSFDDSLFLARSADTAQETAQARPAPAAPSRVVRFADVWRGRQRGSAADADQIQDQTSHRKPGRDKDRDGGLLDGLLDTGPLPTRDPDTGLANSNDAPGRQRPDRNAAMPRDAALAALLDDVPAHAAASPPAATAARDPLDDLLDGTDAGPGPTAMQPPALSTLEALLRDPLDEVLGEALGEALGDPAEAGSGAVTPQDMVPKDTGRKDTGRKDTGRKDTGTQDTGTQDTALAFALAFADPPELQPEPIPEAEPAADPLAALLGGALEGPFPDRPAPPAAGTDAETAGMADLLGPDLLGPDLLADLLRDDDAPDDAPPASAAALPPAPPGATGADADWAGDWDLALALAGEAQDDPADLPPKAVSTAVPPPTDPPQDAPQDAPEGTRATASPAQGMIGIQDPVGADLLADLLRDDDTARDTTAPAAIPGTPPFTPPPFTPPRATPVPGLDPGAARQRRDPRQDAGNRGGMDDLDRVLQVGAARPVAARKWLVRLIWAILLGGLIYVAFLPYSFEVGGEFTVQPIDRAEVRARTSGEITALHVTEGDWVEAGAVMAVLSNWNQTRDVALIRAEGARLQAQLATLMAGARPEEIAVAEQALASAEVQLTMRAQDLERQESLFASGTIAQKAVEDARSAHQLALSNRDQAAATLTLVQAGARETEIAGLQAAIAGNAEELAFAELMLEYTNIRAPVSGQIVNSLNEVPVGHSLPVGGLFAEIENNRTVVAELAVPEITIQEVVLGAPVELRLWSNPHETITGTVRSMAPRAEAQDFGQVVRVQVEVPNPDGRLAANLTGFGKIAAEERPVWQAFSRAIERFFVIEVWSWLP